MITIHTFGDILSGTALLLCLAGCGNNTATTTCTWPSRVEVPAVSFMPGEGEEAVRFGGYGSDLAFSAVDSTFWLLTDRGPNVDGSEMDSKVFPFPEFIPHVGVFRCEGDSFRLVRKIELKDASGVPFCGLPNESGNGRTGEKAYDTRGNEVYGKRKGIDPEGLALMPDGTFWVSDEYGPFLMHFSSDGYCLEVRSPFNHGLPEVYACRRPNRGMEGLCANREGTLLYGALQSPMADSVGYAPKNSVPLCAISLKGNDVREYAYPLDEGAEGVSALACLDDSTLLVLERDGRFPLNGKAMKRIYKVVLPACISGKPYLLSKDLVLDLMVKIPDYPHDKAEGLAVIGDSVIAVANDDDFGITADCDGKVKYVPKLCPDGKPDRNEVYFMSL